jgi:3-deoxy-D-manno-octulosonic-acid transferase/heptosyltransferase-1
MNILIVKMSAIGDVIHTLPALNALRAHFPEAHIAWLVEEAAAPLVMGHEALDRVLVSRRKKWIKGLLESVDLSNIKEASRFIRQLRDTRYDLVLDFQSLLKSGVLVGLLRGQRKVGFDQGMEHMEKSHLFLNEPVPPVDMDMHALLRGMALLESLGIKNSEIAYNLPIQKKDREAASELIGEGAGVRKDRPFIVIHPVAKWETKLWSNERFSELADRLVEKYDAEVAFTGSHLDRPVVYDIRAHMISRSTNLAGETTLKILAALYEKADAVISTDTGPMHLAAAVGTTVVALFGPTAPWRTGPFGSGHQVVRADLECSPCFKRQCETKACMKQISVGAVMDGVGKILSGV